MNTLKIKSLYNRRGRRVADRYNNLFADDFPEPSAPPENNLQDSTFERMRDSLVTVYLVSGIRLSGVLKQFDGFTLLPQEPTKCWCSSMRSAPSCPARWSQPSVGSGAGEFR